VVLVVNVFLFNHFAEGSRIQTYDFVREPHKKNYHKSIDTFCFIALTKSVTQIIRGVTERHYLSKGILSQQESDIKLLWSMCFVYEVGIVSSYSNRIGYRKIAKAAKGMLGSCMRLLEQCLRTIVQQITPRLPATMSQP